MAEPVVLDLDGFHPEATDKVMRLMPILDRVSAHPFLKTRVCLHGGTALNLFVLKTPRLSVDIDLNYIGSTDRETMLAERPRVETAITQIGQELGFTVLPSKSEHSGQSFRLQYHSGRGLDHVKIDLDFLNRSPLLPVESSTVMLTTGAEVTFPLNSVIELFAGKTKALLERVAIRDLYDITQISPAYAKLATFGDERLMRRVMLYHLSISAPFPRPFEVVNRFSTRNREVADTLYPMLLSTDRPTLADMIAVANQFVEMVSHPINEEETAYIAHAARGDFVPELLFTDYPETLAAAQVDPAAAWKFQNLTAP